MVSMIGATAIPSNEINYSFNFEQFFICRSGRCSLDHRNRKNFSSEICKKSVLFENCSSVCFQKYIVTSFQRKKLK